MVCEQCKAQLEDNANYCTNCGQSIISITQNRKNNLFFQASWNDPTTLDTLETVNTVDNDHMKHQEEKVIPWQINYTQTSSNKRQSIKL